MWIFYVIIILGDYMKVHMRYVDFNELKTCLESMERFAISNGNFFVSIVNNDGSFEHHVGDEIYFVKSRSSIPYSREMVQRVDYDLLLSGTSFPINKTDIKKLKKDM